jgi:ADP-heptose:LPS heptosyltransferase
MVTPHLFCLGGNRPRDKDKVSHLLVDKQVAVTQENGRPHRRLPEGVVVHDSFCLGDLVYLGAMLAALREQVPTLPISVVVGGMAKDFPFFETIGVRRIELAVPWDDRRWYKRPIYTLKGLPRAARNLRSLARESILADPRGDLRHVAVATLAGRRTVSSLSLETWGRLWGRLPNHIFIARRDWLWKLQDSLGLPRTEPKWPWIKVPSAPPKDPGSPPTVLLSPGVAGRLREWSPEKWKQLASVLRNMGLHCVFIREPGRRPSVLDDEEEWSGNIDQLASLVASADLVVAVDSFVGHLSAAIGTPTLTLFGPQLPELWKPWGSHADYVIAEPFSCRPCVQRRCVQPAGASCMDLLQLKVVADAVDNFFSRTAPAT